MLNRKLVLLAATALVSGMLSVPAWAEVNIAVIVKKDKNITVTEQITITKTATITVLASGNFNGLAESDALVNANITGNDTHLEFGEGADFDTVGADNVNKRVASTTDSVNTNTGVVLQWNQDVGDGVNQGNVLSASLVEVDSLNATTPQSSVGHAEAAVDQETTLNDVFVIGILPDVGTTEAHPIPVQGVFPDLTDFHVLALLDASMKDNGRLVGGGAVIQGNQNAGQNNNQHNVLSAGIGVGALLALGESALGQESSGNFTKDLNTYKADVINNSVDNNLGIVSFNQSVGHNNNQAAVITIAATTAATALLPNQP